MCAHEPNSPKPQPTALTHCVAAAQLPTLVKPWLSRRFNPPCRNTTSMELWLGLRVRTPAGSPPRSGGSTRCSGRRGGGALASPEGVKKKKKGAVKRQLARDETVVAPLGLEGGGGGVERKG